MAWTQVDQACSVSQLPFSYLIAEKRRFVWPVGISIGVSSERLHVRDRHSQDGQLVWFPCQRAARGNHVRQFSDVSRHLVPPPPLNLTVILPGARKWVGRNGEKSSDWNGENRRGNGQRGAVWSCNITVETKKRSWEWKNVMSWTRKNIIK